MNLKGLITKTVTLAFILTVLTASVYAGQGVLDTTFGTNGVKDFSFSSDVYTTGSVLSGNKIWFTGRKAESPRSHFIYGRFSLDGTLDFMTTVRPCQEVPNDPLNDESIGNAIALQSDGKLLVTGKCNTFGGTNFSDPFVARINPDGLLDSTFGTGGIAKFSLREGDCFAGHTGYDIAADPDGNIIVVGGDGVQPATPCNNSLQSSVALKISPIGTRISLSYTPLASSNGNRFAALTIQPDGKFLVGRNINSVPTGVEIHRFNSDLTPDTTFGTNGVTTIPLDSGYNKGDVYSIYLESNGKIVVSGKQFGGFGGSASGVYARFLPNGTLDTTFNGTGKLAVETFNSGITITGNKLFRQPDGKYLAGGVQGWGGIRINGNGTIDSTYGNIRPGVSYFNPINGNLGVDGSSDNTVRLADGSLFEIGSPNPNANRNLVRLVKIRQNQNRNSDRYDFDGDAKTDISIFRPSVGQWYYLRSSNSVVNGATFGSSTDKPVPADYTGDGLTDLAFFVPSTGQWFVLRSEDSSYYAFPFGAPGDIPTPADFDGDGRADAAVYRPSTGVWYINKSTGGVTITSFGTSTDKPVVADYDGDGKSDIAIFRSSVGEWYYVRSSDSQVRGAQFGSSTDKPVQGDYTGDGKADLAFFRPSTGSWFVLRSEDSSFFASPFGASTDIATPGDYDGDGKFDQAVFRPSTGVWYVNRTTAGVLIQTFGISTDTPVPAAFVP